MTAGALMYLTCEQPHRTGRCPVAFAAIQARQQHQYSPLVCGCSERRTSAVRLRQVILPTAAAAALNRPHGFGASRILRLIIIISGGRQDARGHRRRPGRVCGDRSGGGGGVVSAGQGQALWERARQRPYFWAKGQQEGVCVCRGCRFYGGKHVKQKNLSPPRMPLSMSHDADLNPPLQWTWLRLSPAGRLPSTILIALSPPPVNRAPPIDPTVQPHTDPMTIRRAAGIPIPRAGRPLWRRKAEPLTAASSRRKVQPPAASSKAATRSKTRRWATRDRWT